ncbi:MAG TPA: FAD-dependent oxidoreductase [Clostridiales bacterium]|nr:FAD-dependent oxidoreductase [Clostridiales bacterium]
MQSLWETTAQPPSFGQLEGDIACDVLIVGGGLAGLLCAYMLKEAGIDYVLTEAGKICSGVTKNTTAKITSQHGLIYDKLIRRFGIEKAKLYLRANEEALQRYRELCKKIGCHFEEKENIVYSTKSKSKIDKEIAALKALGYPAESLDSLSLPFPIQIAGAVKFPRQAQFNPLEFASAISRGLRIYEHTRVREFIDTTAVTDRGKIFAKRIVIATHYPIINKHGLYFIKMYQHRSYVIALEGAPPIDGMFVDEAPDGMSFRMYENLLFVGGGDHRTGKQGGGWQVLRDFARKNMPRAVEKHHWATQDCITLDEVPYIGRYSKNTENLYVATGFNKWGMTSSMVAASLLCELLKGKSSPYEAVFDPSRSILRPKLLLNAGSAVVNILTPTSPRCPHMGCALKWNPTERTWDCPCHGSRFDADGRLIDGPATGNIRLSQRILEKYK